MRFAPQQKLALHTEFSRYMAGEKIYPIGLEISPSGICQATCPFCWYAQGAAGSHRAVFLDRARTIRLLEEAAALRIKAITWTGGGDPSLHRDIAEFVDTSQAFGLDQGMFTNALAMPKYDPSKLSWIRVTMTDKPYREDCILALRPCKTLGFAFNYAGEQDDVYLWQTLKLADAVRADYVQVRPALKFNGETVDIQPPVLPSLYHHPLIELAYYKFADAKRKHGYSTCEGFHFVPFIWEDGNVDVCAYMRNHEGYTLGNIYKQSLKEILDKAPQSVPVHANCQVCCKLHETNKLIHSMRLVEDRNFP